VGGRGGARGGGGGGMAMGGTYNCMQQGPHLSNHCIYHFKHCTIPALRLRRRSAPCRRCQMSLLVAPCCDSTWTLFLRSQTQRQSEQPGPHSCCAGKQGGLTDKAAKHVTAVVVLVSTANALLYLS
jgi:hypothetical protein